MSCLKNSIIAKTREHEEASAKLRALQELDSQNGQVSSSNGESSNGHDPKLSRCSKLRHLSQRLNEQASLEEHVSDRTKKILESMRRERLSTPHHTSVSTIQHNSFGSSRRTSLSRQSSFLIEGDPEMKNTVNCDNREDRSSAAHGSVFVGRHISNLVREQELPTVKKYHENSKFENLS